jgi:ElaB/YqjD/DUF883 family membrane-anchored ribosome-binding protein
MSQNRTDFGGTSATGNPGTGNTQTGNTGSGTNAGNTGATGTGTGTATGLAQTAQEYGTKITEAASQAKDFVTDKVSVVGEKIKDLQNVDYREVAENAKDYARQNPGQAILISAAAGFLLGLIIRGRR